MLLGGGVAYAYWSSTGTGTGSATTGDSAQFLVNSTAGTVALTPGGPGDTIAFTVKNPGTGTQNLSKVLVTVATSTGGTFSVGAGPNPPCTAADYTLGTPAITYGAIAAGATVSGTVTIQMNNLATNQDNCKTVTVPLYFVAS